MIPYLHEKNYEIRWSRLLENRLTWLTHSLTTINYYSAKLIGPCPLGTGVQNEHSYSLRYSPLVCSPKESYLVTRNEFHDKASKSVAVATSRLLTVCGRSLVDKCYLWSPNVHLGVFQNPFHRGVNAAWKFSNFEVFSKIITVPIRTCDWSRNCHFMFDDHSTNLLDIYFDKSRVCMF